MATDTDANAVRRIVQLSPSLVNRIAAGEVIERPASVVKELVENALDAGASRILVEIEDGGRELIRVVDDGHGIGPEDLSLAFAEHATSKIRSDEDLFKIATMGFRGEALASIGSVSVARIVSRVRGRDEAYEIFNRGGVIGDAQAAAGNAGTTVEVRNLFFNTPARRKFMKGAGTEFGHIAEMVMRLAVPYPQVAFMLSHNGKVALDLPAGVLMARLLAAWPEDFHEMRLPLETRDAEIRISGLVGLPELARPTNKYQFVYLNGRHIRDKFVQHALREAYRGLTEPGRHPAAILMIEAPPGDVDVNVHPTKIEVRFRDSGRVHGLVLTSVREKLLGSDLTPAAQAGSGWGWRGDNVEPADRTDMRAKLAAFFQGIPGTSSAPQAAAPLELRAQDGPAPVLEFTPKHETSGIATTQAAVGIPSPAPSSSSVSEGAPAIQLHNSYLVTETAEGMLIIDQHALHERIMYEELRARVMRGPLESQRMLIPATVPATSRQMAVVEQIGPLLSRLGIEASPFGPGTLAVHAFPTFLSRLDPVEFMTDLLERGEQELLDLHDEELLHEIMDMMACKAAIKAGDVLSAGEIQALLARKDLVDRSSNCPHGRPTTLRLSLRDLEKQFKRTGF